MDEYACESCNGKHKTTKRIQLWRLPKVLMFTVRRFTPMGTKDNTPIQYNGEILSFSSLFAPESNEPSRDKKYNIFGTVVPRIKVCSGVGGVAPLNLNITRGCAIGKCYKVRTFIR